MSALGGIKTAHTGITVSNLDRSIAFYRDVMGFPVSEKLRLRGKLFELVTGVAGAEIDIANVDAPGHQIELLQYAGPTPRVASNLRPCDPGFLHLAFKVQNLENVLVALRAAGYEAAAPLHSIDECLQAGAQGLRGVYTRDPDGVVIEVFEDAALS